MEHMLEDFKPMEIEQISTIDMGDIMDDTLPMGIVPEYILALALMLDESPLELDWEDNGF